MSTPTWPSQQDLEDLQGDVVLGIPKRTEDFIFFNIQDVGAFKRDLKELIPVITTTADIQKVRKDIDNHKKSGKQDLLKCIGINIAFSTYGLQKLGITEDLGDPSFKTGQLKQAEFLGDTGKTESGTFVPDWIEAFKNEIDGIILVAGDSRQSVQEGDNKIEHVLGNSIKEVLKVHGQVRPGKEKGHEHFGFLDGISSPAIEALTGSLPGQIVVPPGVLVCGTDGDTVSRPSWAKNGTFLVYRQLQQLVPEFNKFLHDNPVLYPGLPRDQGSELLGARFFGRWKSGAPIELSPLKDDPELAKDKQKNNDFDFSDSFDDQTKCPFAAHIRKTNPRADLLKLPNVGGPQLLDPHMIMRKSIAYGPEVTPEEEHENKTIVDRGLAFVCYQSNVANGFEFVQHSWSNNVAFPPGKTLKTPGFDPIIGQNNGAARETAGLQINNQNGETTLPIEFVVSKGGAYFFTPSITALKTKLTA